MLNTHIASLTATPALVKAAAATTQDASSGWIDVKGYEGQVGVVILNGEVSASDSIAFTFNTATTSQGAGSAPIVPLKTPTVASEGAAEPLAQIAVFNATQLKGYLQVVGTVTGSQVAVDLAYTVIGLKKYAG